MEEDGFENIPPIPICGCGSTRNVAWGVDPYRWEILNDDTECWMCENCVKESQMDI